MLSLKFRLVGQYICVLFVRILSIIDLISCFHVSCVSKWSPRYLTYFVYVMCVSFNWILGGFRFLSVNVIWLRLPRFAFICWSCSHFSIFVMCSCSNVTAVSSANVSILLLVVVGMPVVVLFVPGSVLWLFVRDFYGSLYQMFFS